MPFRDHFRSRSSSPNAINPYDWNLPHRFPTSSNVDKQADIPDPAIFRDLFLPLSQSIGSTLPSTSGLAAHLCLLECFHKFKQDVVESEYLDVVFEGLVDKEEVAYSNGIAKSPAAGKASIPQDQNDLKWNLVVKSATARFEA